MKLFLRFSLLPVALVILWHTIVAMSIVDALFVPAPFAVLSALVDGFLNGPFLADTFATLGRTVVGFLVSAAVGIPAGLLIGRIRALQQLTQGTIDFIRSIPATALFPLFLLAFGVGDTAKIAVVIYGCALIMLVNTAYGAAQVNSVRIASAKLVGASPLQIFFSVILPEAAPSTIAGVRIALSTAFVLVVVTEMFIGTTIGLGYRIIDAQSVYRVPDMYAAIFVVGMLGLAANWIVVWNERRILHWVGK